MGPPLGTTRLAAQMGGKEMFDYFSRKVAKSIQKINLFSSNLCIAILTKLRSNTVS